MPPSAPRRVFGLPLGDFGLFATLLLPLTLGFITFFTITFLSIVAILLLNSTGHGPVDYAIGYKLLALPAALVVWIASLAFFVFLWFRRKLEGN